MVSLLFGDSSRTSGAKCSFGVRETPHFEPVGAVCHMWPFSQIRCHFQTFSQGLLQGLLWVIPAIGPCLHSPLRSFLVFVGGLSPQTWSKPPQSTTFDAKHHCLAHGKPKKDPFQMPAFFSSVDQGYCQIVTPLCGMRPFLVAKVKLPSATRSQPTTHPHSNRKIGPSFKIRVFYEARAELRVDDPRKTAWYPQDTPRARPPQAAAGS